MKNLLLLLLLACFASPAYSLRCQQRLVSVGDYHSDVLHKCGRPDFVDKWVEHRQYREYHPSLPRYWDRYGKVHIEEWLYNFGRSRFQRLLRFENGKLRRIKSLGYGYSR